MRKFFRVIIISILSFVVLAVLAVTLFINFYPSFGANPSKEKQLVFAESDNYKDGKFRNLEASPMDVNLVKVFNEYTRKAPNRNPKSKIQVDKINEDFFENYNDSTVRLTWFGHSAFLMEIDGKKLLLDPMFGKAAAPHPWLGPNRYYEDLPIKTEDLPEIDAVIFSHDHYDHLDHGTILKLKDKVGVFYTPLGVGSHLKSWGVSAEKIIEMDWWDKTSFEGLDFICTPSRHFSGRGLFDRGSTLWASWIIKSNKHNIYFSGDSGYGKHFKEIGDKYGPFDISMMECGQYNEDWKFIHMMPEETVIAAADLRSKLVMPIHWGAFTLAFHDWTDPVERSTAKARELGIPIATPRIGEPLVLGDKSIPSEKWWIQYSN